MLGGVDCADLGGDAANCLACDFMYATSTGCLDHLIAASAQTGGCGSQRATCVTLQYCGNATIRLTVPHTLQPVGVRYDTVMIATASSCLTSRIEFRRSRPVVSRPARNYDGYYV